MSKPKLLASTHDLITAIKMAAVYWCTHPDRINLIPSAINPDVFDVTQAGKLMTGFRVIRKGKRYRFERTGEL